MFLIWLKCVLITWYWADKNITNRTLSLAIVLETIDVSMKFRQAYEVVDMCTHIAHRISHIQYNKMWKHPA